MTTHRVIANAGFISDPMSALKAYHYARRLEQLGNYDIHIMQNHKAEEYRVRRNGGIG